MLVKVLWVAAIQCNFGSRAGGLTYPALVALNFIQASSIAAPMRITLHVGPSIYCQLNVKRIIVSVQWLLSLLAGSFVKDNLDMTAFFKTCYIVGRKAAGRLAHWSLILFMQRLWRYARKSVNLFVEAAKTAQLIIFLPPVACSGKKHTYPCEEHNGVYTAIFCILEPELRTRSISKSFKGWHQ